MTTARGYADRIIELERKRDYRGAHEVLKEALTIYPTQPFLLRTEVYLLLRLNRIKEARIKAESRVEKLKDDPFFLKTYLNVLRQEKAYNDMERLITAILTWSVGDEDFMVFLVKTASQCIGREKGEEILRQALTRFPGSEPLNKLAADGETAEEGTNRFTLYRRKFAGKKTAEAVAEIEAIMAMPGYAGDYDLHLYLAELYKKMERYDQAVAIYSKLLTLRDNEFTRKMLGYTYYKVGDKEQAAVCLKDVFIKRPDDHFLTRTIFKIYEDKRDFEGLEKLVAEALAARPEAKHLYGLLKKGRRWQKDNI
jgi:tetratricopeptide (TPR) repeat protein